MEKYQFSKLILGTQTTSTKRSKCDIWRTRLSSNLWKDRSNGSNDLGNWKQKNKFTLMQHTCIVLRPLHLSQKAEKGIIWPLPQTSKTTKIFTRSICWGAGDGKTSIRRSSIFFFFDRYKEELHIVVGKITISIVRITLSLELY